MSIISADPQTLLGLVNKYAEENEQLRLGIAAASQWIACHGEHGGGPEGVLAIRQVLDNFTDEQAQDRKP